MKSLQATILFQILITDVSKSSKDRLDRRRRSEEATVKALTPTSVKTPVNKKTSNSNTVKSTKKSADTVPDATDKAFIELETTMKRVERADLEKAKASPGEASTSKVTPVT